VADFTAQRRRPDPKPSRPIEHASTPGALMNQSVRGARIGQPFECRQRQLDKVRLMHQNLPTTQCGLTVSVSSSFASQPHQYVGRLSWPLIDDVA
jgi:hypothetical protein